MILKNLRRRATRSALTLLGIAIGVAAVVALGAMAKGMASNYGSAIGLANDLMVSQANALDPLFSSLDADLGQRIQAIPDVDNVDPGVYTWIATDDMPFFLIFGYEPGSVAMDHYRLVEGKPITGPKQVVIGSRAVEALKLGIDDTLRIYGMPYRIVGIYETGQAMEESGGVVTLADAQDITGKERSVSLFQVGLRPGSDPDAVMQRIRTIDDEMTVSLASGYDAGESWSSYLDAFAWGLAAIAVLIGGLGMMSAMVMSVLERTREIGTLRAVGWSRRRVMGMIMGESVLLSGVGGIFGVLMGMGMAWGAAQIPGVGGFLEGAVSPGIVIQGMITALSLGVIGGLYPAWTAANLQPVEALRYEGGGAGEVTGFLSRVGSQSFRNLWRRRTRTLLSAGGISIGVATLVMLGGLVDGMISQLNSLAGSGGAGNLTVMQRDVPDMSLSTLDERMVNQIQAMPEVRAVSPMVLGFVMTADLPLFIISGLDPNSAAMEHYKLVEGRAVQRPNEVIVGRLATENYGLELGGTVTLYNTRYRIVGVFETGVTFEEGGGVMAMREAQRLLNRPRSISYMFVDVHNPADADRVRDTINHRFPDAKASLSSEFAQNTNDIASTKAMTDAILLMAFIVGGVVVTNTMIMSIYERTREIGTLRALGWKKQRILSQIMQESMLLCALSAVMGSLLGVAAVMGLANMPVANQAITPVWSVATFVQAAGLAIGLGVLGGFYPAWRASRLKPIEALRYE